MSFLFSKNKKQLKPIFDWLSGVVNQDDLILLEREGKREGYYFEFPLKFGDKPRKIKTFNKDNIAFLIKLPQSKSNSDKDKNEWQLIFQSPELGIYESRKRFEGKQAKPLRWCLSEEEKRTALKIARKSIEIFLKEKRIPKTIDFSFSLSGIFYLKTDLDVALWTNGVVRGSWVVENNFLGEGIIEAAIFACRDTMNIKKRRCHKPWLNRASFFEAQLGQYM